MTDADNARLVQWLSLADSPVCWWAADRLEAQDKEIEELRGKLAVAELANEGHIANAIDDRNEYEAEIRDLKAALAEALKVMHDVRDICTFDVTMEGAKYTGTNASACIRAYKAASAFVAKHEERNDAGAAARPRS